MANMSDELWCFIEGETTSFPVIASSTMFICRLKYEIKEKNKLEHGVLSGVDAKQLTLWKVRYFSNQLIHYRVTPL